MDSGELIILLAQALSGDAYTLVTDKLPGSQSPVSVFCTSLGNSM